MEIEMMAICDFAAVMGGKAVITGVFDSINPPQLPLQMRSSVYWRVRFKPSEYGKHLFEIAITNTDGTPQSQPLQGEFQISSGGVPNIDSAVAELAIGLNLELKTHGKMTFTLKMDGKTLRTIPLYVLPAVRPN